MGKRIPNRLESSFSVLHVLLSAGETSTPYNEHCLAMAGQRNIAVCTYFESQISPPDGISLYEGDGSLRGFFRELEEALAKNAHDILHAHTPHVGFLLLIARIFMRGEAMPPKVYTVHNSYQNFKLRNKLLLIPIFALFEKVVCCSEASFESFPNYFKWLARDRVSPVQNGIDIDRVDRTIGKNLPTFHRRKFTVATIGRLIQIKNPLTVLRALKKNGDQYTRLLFIGDGNLRDALEAECRILGLGNQVELIGLIPRNHVYEHLAKADLFISASRGEGLPIAALEAMACGCPVLLSDIQPHKEIADGVGFIPFVQPEDVDGFAEEMRRFQSMSPHDRSILGARCRKLVEERFSLISMHKRYEKIYLQLLNGNYRKATSLNFQ